MHSAEHRALRELFAAARHLRDHWGSLAGRLGDAAAAEALRAGADDVRGLLLELRDAAAARDLYGRPAAQGVGVNLAGVRRVVTDRFLERNQALRFAALDVVHVVTLLRYIGELARRRGDADLAALCDRWAQRMGAHEAAARDAVVALAQDPDVAIEPLDPSPAGRAAHAVANAVGTVGEWVDRRAQR